VAECRCHLASSAWHAVFVVAILLHVVLPLEPQWHCGHSAAMVPSMSLSSSLLLLFVLEMRVSLTERALVILYCTVSNRLDNLCNRSPIPGWNCASCMSPHHHQQYSCTVLRPLLRCISDHHRHRSAQF
jgi:hypothetical protein